MGRGLAFFFDIVQKIGIFNLSGLNFVLNSCPGKFGAILASIPLPIVAALYCVLFAYVGMYYMSTLIMFI
jgi:xanthine/uracil permease